MPTLLAWLVILLFGANAAHAQQPGPIPRFVADVRAFNTGLGQDPTTADDLGIDPDVLPRRAFGGVAGVHVYILRTRTFAVGVGAEGLFVRGRGQLEDSNGSPIGFPVNQRVRSLSPVVSVNFGSRDGWSYLTAGMGPLSFSTYLGDTAPTDPPPSKMTINLGGGARWFFARHIALNLDVRFYQTRPEETLFPYPSRERTKLTVLSGGISIR